MEKKTKPQRFRADIRFQNRVREQTRAALVQKEEAFAKDHKGDTDEQLLEYVREFSKELGRTPNAGEIIGGRYIASRFCGWEVAVAAANLPAPGRPASLENRLIYKKEYKLQEKLVRQAYIEEKNAAKEIRRQKNADGRVAAQKKQEQDLLWGREHVQDTDDQLIEYVKMCAKSLGHSPVSQEVQGASFISRRFGSWAVVLTVAELPLPSGIEPPNPKTLKAYKERQKTAADTK